MEFDCCHSSLEAIEDGSQEDRVAFYFMALPPQGSGTESCVVQF